MRRHLNWCLVVAAVACVFALTTPRQISAAYYFNCGTSEPSINTDTNTLMCDDFEDASWICTDADTDGGRNNPDNDGWSGKIEVVYPDANGTCFARANGAAGTGYYATHGEPTTYNYPSTDPHTQGNHGKHTLADANPATGDAGYQEIYIRFYTRISTGYIPGHEKFFIPQKISGYQCCVLMFNNGLGHSNSRLQLDSFHDTGWHDQNVSWFGNICCNKWVYTEVHIKLNTNPSCTFGSNCDGVFEMWQNDCGTDGLGCDPSTGSPTLRSQHTTLKLRSAAGDQLEDMWLENWSGGPCNTGNSCSEGTKDMDQLVVSKAFIGFAPLQSSSLAIFLAQWGGVLLAAGELVASILTVHLFVRRYQRALVEQYQYAIERGYRQSVPRIMLQDLRRDTLSMAERMKTWVSRG